MRPFRGVVEFGIVLLVIMLGVTSDCFGATRCAVHGGAFLLVRGSSSHSCAISCGRLAGSDAMAKRGLGLSLAAQKPWWMFWEPDVAAENALFGKNELPCATQVGVALLSQLEDGGEDAFVEALQMQLVAFRSKWQSMENVAANSESLQARIAEVERVEEQQQVLADLLHIGTIYRLRAEDMELTRGPLEATVAPEGGPALALNLSLSASLQPLPEEVAIEVKDYVYAAVPANLKADMSFRVSNTSLAPLLMGGALFGYVIGKAAEAARGTSPPVTKQDLTNWNSTGAFVAAAFHVGKLLGLDPESEDPLRQFGSLEQIATEVRALPNDLESLEDQYSELTSQEKLNMTMRDVRGLLGEMCTMGFVLHLWESKVMRFVAAANRS